MPPKTPAKTPAESPAEPPASVFGFASEIAARIEQEGADTVYVTVLRERPDSIDPEHCHDYPGAAWSIDAVRSDFGPGKYVCAIYRRNGRQYVTRKTITIGPAPRSLSEPAPPQRATAATPPPAPGTAPTSYDPMSIMMMMMQQAEQRAAESQRQFNALLQTIITRPHTDPLDALGKLAPLLKQDNPSDPASIVKLAREMGRDFAGAAGKGDRDDKEPENSGVLDMIGTVLGRAMESYMNRPAVPRAPQQQQPPHPQRRPVPNTAPSAPPPPPPPAPAPHDAAPQSSAPVADATGDTVTPNGRTDAPASPLRISSEDDTPTEGDDYPVGLHLLKDHSPQEISEVLEIIDDAERRAESMNLHASVGTMAGTIKYGCQRNAFYKVIAADILTWFEWWGEDQDEAQAAEDTLRDVLNECRNAEQSTTLTMLAAFADTPRADCVGVAKELIAAAETLAQQQQQQKAQPPCETVGKAPAAPPTQPADVRVGVVGAPITPTPPAVTAPASPTIETKPTTQRRRVKITATTPTTPTP